VANILLYSSNPQISGMCKSHLAEIHSLKIIATLEPQHHADILLLDARAVDRTPELLSIAPSHASHYLIIGHRWPEQKQIQALLHGASGYFEQTQPPELLIKAISSIQSGEIWIHRKLVPQVIQSMIAKAKYDITAHTLSPDTPIALSSLSKREIDVATRIATGQNNKQIAQNLNISERTVKAHLTSIFKKLNISDRLHLALLMNESH